MIVEVNTLLVPMPPVNPFWAACRRCEVASGWPTESARWNWIGSHAARPNRCPAPIVKWTAPEPAWKPRISR